MTTTLTPAEFMALPSDPEVDEDLDICAPVAQPADPGHSLKWMAESLATLAQAAGVSSYLDQQATSLAEQLEEATRQLADAEALNLVQADLIERVLEVVKPSASKVADSVRAVLAPPAVEPEPAAPSSGEHNNDHDAPPAADAGVEEWRAYARRHGYTGPDVDKANRSQIRTMLGVEHPGSDGAS